MYPYFESDQHRRHGRERYRGITNQRPAAKRRQRIGNDAHRRQYNGINPGMAEDPEQVLPQQWLTVVGDVKKMSAELPVEPQQEKRETDRGYCQQIGDR